MSMPPEPDDLDLRVQVLHEAIDVPSVERTVESAAPCSMFSSDIATQYLAEKRSFPCEAAVPVNTRSNRMSELGKSLSELSL